MSPQQVARTLDVPLKVVYYWRRRSAKTLNTPHPVAPKGTINRLDAQTQAFLRRLLAKNVAPKEIAETLDLDISRVYWEQRKLRNEAARARKAEAAAAKQAATEAANAAAAEEAKSIMNETPAAVAEVASEVTSTAEAASVVPESTPMAAPAPVGSMLVGEADDEKRWAVVRGGMYELLSELQSSLPDGVQLIITGSSRTSK